MGVKPEQFSYHSTYLLAKEAEGRGIKVNKPIKSGPLAGASLVEFTYGQHYEVMVGQRISKTSVIAYWLQKNKEYAKVFFKKAGLSVAPGNIFYAKNVSEIIKFAQKIKFPVVVKPPAGIQGKKVYVDIKNPTQLRRILKEFKGKVLVEKEFKGEEYRIFATKDKFVAAIHRIPANVVGDGVRTIKQLIRLKNKDPRRGSDHRKTLVKIKIDDVVKEHLKKQRLTLDYVPAKGERVFLRQNSNISTGGDSIDVTDMVHPEVKKLAPKIIRAIPGLMYAGIDYLTKDITKPPTKNNYIVIEVNESPMLSMHHIPYEGKSRNVAKVVIDMMFPETKGRKVKRV